MKKGCPFTNFGDCMKARCLFYLNKKEAQEIIALYAQNTAHYAATPLPQDRCRLLLLFETQRAWLDASAFASDALAQWQIKYSPEPLVALAGMLRSIQHTLSDLQKELKKS